MNLDNKLGAKLHSINRGEIEIVCNSLGGDSPRVIFCPGFYSSRNGEKALALEKWCKNKSIAYTRFDYSGHGDSGGDFANGSISEWLADLLEVIDASLEDQIVLVGSSMGGWLALLAALRRPKLIGGLLLVACAVDMTKYYPKRLAEYEQQTDNEGRAYYAVPNQFDYQKPYLIYQHLIDDGTQYFLLDDAIDLNMPIRLLHGMQDNIVEWQRSLKISERLSSTDVDVTLIKSGDHRLSSRADLTRLEFELALLIASLAL